MMMFSTEINLIRRVWGAKIDPVDKACLDQALQYPEKRRATQRAILNVRFVKLFGDLRGSQWLGFGIEYTEQRYAAGRRPHMPHP